MRQGKLSELIHNSARYPDLDECSVEVHFREIIDLVRISYTHRLDSFHLVKPAHSLDQMLLTSYRIPL